MSTLQISYSDIRGGAARIAWTLHRGFLERGEDSWLAVAHKESKDPQVVEIGGSSTIKAQSGLHDRLATRAQQGLFRHLAELRHAWNRYLGREDFDFPNTQRILNLIPASPKLIHLHNLHYNYFDLRYLEEISHQIPTLLTLHDAWLLSGHCAHSLDCERWKSGCGRCPYLNIYPAIRRDATSSNWQRKRNIYARSKVYVVTPSQWLLDRVKQSILAEAVRQAKVIYNGIDLSVFCQRDKDQARSELGIRADADILLFVASNVQNSYKDFGTVQEAINIVTQQSRTRPLILLALGGDGTSQHIQGAEIRLVKYTDDPAMVAKYYQAADIYIHAAKADTFPNVVLEASACGTPVVATAVGGIPEQVMEGKTGFLTPPGNAEAMAERINYLLEKNELRLAMGNAGADHAKTHFGLDRMIKDYLAYYQEILHAWQEEKRG